MAEAFFNKIAEDVLRATELIQTIMEEGIGVVLNGELPDDGATKASASAASDSTQGASSGHQEFDVEDVDLDNLSDEELERLLAEDMMQSSPLKGIADDVMGNIMSGQIGPQTPREHFDAFRSAITWSENFILALIVFQIVMFIICFSVSRRDRALLPRVLVLAFIGIVVKSSELLNAMGAKHWESFSTQDYFDSRGVFLGIMLSGPLLLDCLMMLFMFLAEASTLLVKVKKQEMKHKKKESKNKPASSSTTATERTKTKKQD